MNRTIKRALITASLVLGAVGVTAGPAMAASPPPGGGSVTGSVTIPGTLTFSLADSSFALTGTPGHASNAATIHWSISTNDGSGWGVTVQAANANMTGTGTNSAVIPVNDVAVYPASQAAANGFTSPPSFLNWNVAHELSSSTAFVVDGASGATTSTQAANDFYAIPGAGTGAMPSGGQNIPNVPADTYSDTIAYVAFGN